MRERERERRTEFVGAKNRKVKKGENLGTTVQEYGAREFADDTRSIEPQDIFFFFCSFSSLFPLFFRKDW